LWNKIFILLSLIMELYMLPKQIFVSHFTDSCSLDHYHHIISKNEKLFYFKIIMESLIFVLFILFHDHTWSKDDYRRSLMQWLYGGGTLQLITRTGGCRHSDAQVNNGLFGWREIRKREIEKREIEKRCWFSLVWYGEK